MPAGAGTPLTAPGGNAAPALADAIEYQNASTFVSFYSTLQQVYNSGSSLAAAGALNGANRFLLWQSGVAKSLTLATLTGELSAGGSLDLGYLEAPNPDVGATGTYALGSTSSDVRLAKAATGVLAAQLGDGSAGASLMVRDAPSASEPSIYGTGSTNNGLGLVGGTVAILQGGARRAAFTGTFNYGLAMAGGDALSWVPGTDAYAGTADTQISRPAAGTVSLDTTGNADGLALLKLGGLRFLGRTSAAGVATTTQLPNDKDLAIHKNTALGTIVLAYNDSGTVKSIALV